MNKKWDPNDFQGKSKVSLETSYRIVAGCIVITTIVTTWRLVWELIKIIF